MIYLIYAVFLALITYEEIKLNQRKSEYRRRRFYLLDPDDGELWE